MRRSSLVAILALLLLAVAGGGIVSAHGGSNSGSGHSGSGGGQHQVELRVRASKAEQGESLKIRVKARHADRDTVLTGQAVVHFASGDVVVALDAHGHGRQLRARVPVAADEALGSITVDVTVTIDGVEQPMVTLTTMVKPPSLDD